MQLVIFHYHFEPGGVTGVVEQSIRSLATLPQEQRPSITIVGGRPTGTDRLVSIGRDAGVAVSAEVVASIDYESNLSIPTEGSAADCSQSIASELIQRFGGCERVWWVHNYHVGKNPYLTDALLSIARSHPHQRIVLHIHDFPESARYENLSRVREEVRLPLYPIRSNVHYAVINTRDRDAMVSAGIPEERVHLLVNPIDLAKDLAPPPVGSAAHRAARETLMSALGWDSAEEDRLIWTYPVRTIRRKNVLEAGLLVRLFGMGARLIVTLPGVSDRERVYSDLVASCYAEGLIPGAWNTGGGDGPPFSTVIAASDRIISSSVQEGFGYQYIDAVRWRRPLVARRLDTMADTLPFLDRHGGVLYDRVAVPFRSPSLSPFRPYLKMRYAEKIDGLADILPEEAVAQLWDELEMLLADDVVDVSFLDPSMQRAVLKDCGDGSYLQELTVLNAGLIASASAIDSKEPGNQDEALAVTFGHEAYAAQMLRIASAPSPVASADTPRTQGEDSEHERSIVARMIATFASLGNLRLLY